MWDWGVEVKVSQSKSQHSVQPRQLQGVRNEVWGPHTQARWGKTERKLPSGHLTGSRGWGELWRETKSDAQKRGWSLWAPAKARRGKSTAPEGTAGWGFSRKPRPRLRHAVEGSLQGTCVEVKEPGPNPWQWTTAGSRMAAHALEREFYVCVEGQEQEGRCAPPGESSTQTQTSQGLRERRAPRTIPGPQAGCLERQWSHQLRQIIPKNRFKY